MTFCTWSIVLAPVLSVCLPYFPLKNLGSEFFQGKKVQGLFCSCFLLEKGNVFLQIQEILALCKRNDEAWAQKKAVMVSRNVIP